VEFFRYDTLKFNIAFGDEDIGGCLGVPFWLLDSDGLFIVNLHKD
jgi:hypothetical protein